MEKENFTILTIIEGIQVESDTVCVLRVLNYGGSNVGYGFRIGDRDYGTIITGPITQVRTFCIKTIQLTLSYLGCDGDAWIIVTIESNINSYNNDNFFYIDNVNEQLVFNTVHKPYFEFNSGGIGELCSIDFLYPVITCIKFMTVIERPL